MDNGNILLDLQKGFWYSRFQFYLWN